MSSAAMKWAARQQLPDATLKAVLKEIAWFAGSNGCAIPSQATIADRTAISERRVRSALAVLERLGLIARQRRSKGRNGRTTDSICLQMHREFDVSLRSIRAARATSGGTESKRTERPVGKNLQPDEDVVPTGRSVRGIVSEQKKDPSQDSEVSQNVSVLAGPPFDRPLRVIHGGRT